MIRIVPPTPMVTVAPPTRMVVPPERVAVAKLGHDRLQITVPPVINRAEAFRLLGMLERVVGDL